MNETTAQTGPMWRYGSIGLLLGIILILAWRLGLFTPRLALHPQPGATDVSTRTVIRLAFSTPPAASGPPDITLAPAVAGSARWDGTELVFVPQQPLAAETTYRVLVSGRFQDTLGRTTSPPSDWTFSTRQPQVLFLAPGPGEPTRLHGLTPGRVMRGEPLTPPEQDVVDYAVAPRGDRIAFSVMADDGGQDLWLLHLADRQAHLWIDCGGARCAGASWSPEGDRIIYERQERVPGGEGYQAHRLWWADAGSQDTVPVFANATSPGTAARLSPDGRWLSYVFPSDGSLRLVELVSGEETAIMSQTGEAAAWAPDSRALAVGSVAVTDERVATRLLIIDLLSATVIDLSAGLDVADGSAAWSPDGAWLAFTRGPARVAAGKQLMRVRPDGSDEQRLTSTLDVHHGPPRWSPEGNRLVFQRFVVGSEDPPSIAVLDLVSGGVEELAPEGYDPAWLP